MDALGRPVGILAGNWQDVTGLDRKVQDVVGDGRNLVDLPRRKRLVVTTRATLGSFALWIVESLFLSSSVGLLGSLSLFRFIFILCTIQRRVRLLLLQAFFFF